MSLALVALLVFLMAALAADCAYSIAFWLIGHPSHPYQRPHHWRRYLFIVSIIAAEVAGITVLAVVLVRTIVEPGLSL